jgi:hypothetical protein
MALSGPVADFLTGVRMYRTELTPLTEAWFLSYFGTVTILCGREDPASLH